MALALRPLFVNVTWGAGGSTSTKSLQLAEVCQSHLNLTTCLHLTCTNMSQALLDDALESAKSIGICNILALRGDPPRNEEYFNPPADHTHGRREFVWAADLVRYIREKYGDYFCIGVATYPEGYADGTCPEHQDPARDLPYLIEKVRAGADFLITQLFYDVDKYIAFEEMLRDHPSGIFRDIPIIPGLMPIQSYQVVRRTTKLSHASLPDSIRDRLESIKGDDAKIKEAGIDILADIISRLRSALPAKHIGFHFYTLNLEKVVSLIIERCRLIPPVPEPVPAQEEAVFEDDFDSSWTLVTNAQRRIRRTSSIAGPNNHLIVDKIEGRRDSMLLESAKQAGFLQTTEPSEQRPDVTLAISEGEGTLGREATWDDFTNGRFGDARSPAFGEIDGYGPSLHMSRSQAIALWGYPVSTADISDIFIRYLNHSLGAIPWSEQGLNDESQAIQNELVALNKKGWWTIASQPAVNCCRSGDPTFGWGPNGGFVWQKAFVEFFCPPQDLDKLEAKLLQVSSRATDADAVSYYAANAKGDYKSNVKSNDGALNAVTWGAFKAKEYQAPSALPHSFLPSLANRDE